VATSAETPSAETPGAGAEASATPDAATQPVAIESSGDTPAGAAGSDAETAAAPATPVASPAPTSDATPKTNPAETVSTEANAAEVSDAPADAGQVDPAATPADGEAVADGDAQDTAQDKAAKGKGGDLKGGGQKPKEKSRKRFSPRQKRRKWLVGVLQPLAGKRHRPDKLSAFQIVMLGRALRSGVAQCQFLYDAVKLVAHLKKVARRLNPTMSNDLSELAEQHEGTIRGNAETVWWEELQENAAQKLTRTMASQLRQQMMRTPVQAQMVLSIDALGPRTAAAAVVAADGRVVVTEDLPCQMSAAFRAQAMARIGELVHQYNIDLVVVSNGPARRGVLAALTDLLNQTELGTLRWTLAERSGADLYAGNETGDREMKRTPRRFRAAAWLAFSALYPSLAIAKIDPTKLRLGSYQRELHHEALQQSLS
ncbi:MAG: hypothetical protein AAFN70_15940, partial [Planctomycetota bacterium]